MREFFELLEKHKGITLCLCMFILILTGHPLFALLIALFLVACWVDL